DQGQAYVGLSQVSLEMLGLGDEVRMTRLNGQEEERLGRAGCRQILIDDGVGDAPPPSTVLARASLHDARDALEDRQRLPPAGVLVRIGLDVLRLGREIPSQPA